MKVAMEVPRIKQGQGLQGAKPPDWAIPALTHSQMSQQHSVSSGCRKALVLSEGSSKLYSLSHSLGFLLLPGKDRGLHLPQLSALAALLSDVMLPSGN